MSELLPVQPPVAPVGSAHSDVALDYMLRHNYDITIDSYLSLIYPEGVPEGVSLYEVLPSDFHEQLEASDVDGMRGPIGGVNPPGQA